jgi:hypothetical protein
MTPLKKKLCLFESGWLNGGNDGLPWFYDWMRFVAVAGFDYCLNHSIRDKVGVQNPYYCIGMILALRFDFLPHTLIFKN